MDEKAFEVVSGEKIGRDPREMTVPELNELGHEASPLRKIIRAKCLDCCCDQQSEVRKCTAWRCALWPYRMNKNPFIERVASGGGVEALQKWRDAQKKDDEVELS